mmetsp:Transcript_16108/g.51407  ORF Transcript_16108/g.51407 Transcript_16108/m.51407 type:complete len:203 (-) Transcript_16108:449-1057(-)
MKAEVGMCVNSARPPSSLSWATTCYPASYSSNARRRSGTQLSLYSASSVTRLQATNGWAWQQWTWKPTGALCTVSLPLGRSPSSSLTDACEARTITISTLCTATARGFALPSTASSDCSTSTSPTAPARRTLTNLRSNSWLPRSRATRRKKNCYSSSSSSSRLVLAQATVSMSVLPRDIWEWPTESATAGPATSPAPTTPPP